MIRWGEGVSKKYENMKGKKDDGGGKLNYKYKSMEDEGKVQIPKYERWGESTNTWEYEDERFNKIFWASSMDSKLPLIRFRI